MTWLGPTYCLRWPSRAVVVLHHYVGLNVDEIARELDLPAGTLKSRLSRLGSGTDRNRSPAWHGCEVGGLGHAAQVLGAPEERGEGDLPVAL